MAFVGAQHLPDEGGRCALIEKDSKRKCHARMILAGIQV